MIDRLSKIMVKHLTILEKLKWYEQGDNEPTKDAGSSFVDWIMKNNLE